MTKRVETFITPSGGDGLRLDPYKKANGSTSGQVKGDSTAAGEQQKAANNPNPLKAIFERPVDTASSGTSKVEPKKSGEPLPEQGKIPDVDKKINRDESAKQQQEALFKNKEQAAALKNIEQGTKFVQRPVNTEQGAKTHQRPETAQTTNTRQPVNPQQASQTTHQAAAMPAQKFVQAEPAVKTDKPKLADHKAQPDVKTAEGKVSPAQARVVTQAGEAAAAGVARSPKESAQLKDKDDDNNIKREDHEGDEVQVSSHRQETLVVGKLGNLCGGGAGEGDGEDSGAQVDIAATSLESGSWVESAKKKGFEIFNESTEGYEAVKAASIEFAEVEKIYYKIFDKNVSLDDKVNNWTPDEAVMKRIVQSSLELAQSLRTALNTKRVGPRGGMSV